MYNYNLSTWKAQAGGPLWVWGQPGQQSSQDSQGCLEQNKTKQSRGSLRCLGIQYQLGSQPSTSLISNLPCKVLNNAQNTDQEDPRPHAAVAVRKHLFAE